MLSKKEKLMEKVQILKGGFIVHTYSRQNIVPRQHKVLISPSLDLEIVSLPSQSQDISRLVAQ